MSTARLLEETPDECVVESDERNAPKSFRGAVDITAGQLARMSAAHALAAACRSSMRRAAFDISAVAVACVARRRAN